MTEKKGVLMVCLGNICRSTMAEAVFDNEIKKRGLDQYFVDSCGTAGYHVGNLADRRTLEVLDKHGITDYKHRARQLCKDDFDKFDYIWGMDADNIEDINNFRRRCKNTDSKAKVEMFGTYHPSGKTTTVRDPYYSSNGLKAFEECYDLCVEITNSFLDKHA